MLLGSSAQSDLPPLYGNAVLNSCLLRAYEFCRSKRLAIGLKVMYEIVLYNTLQCWVLHGLSAEWTKLTIRIVFIDQKL